MRLNITSTAYIFHNYPVLYHADIKAMRLSTSAVYKRTTNQSECAQNGECFVVGESNFNETEADDKQIKAVPAVLEVAKQPKRHDLQRSFGHEDSGEYITT